jgi:ribonucleoside-diphosphate reductase alpha chain
MPAPLDYYAAHRQRLPDRRASEVFEFKAGGLHYTASISRFGDGKIGELFLNNHKSNSSADTNARDSAIAFSFAVQHGADADAIRRALSRDAQGRALGPLGVALDIVAEGDER